jgi:C4-type Zn-finger protein
MDDFDKEIEQIALNNASEINGPLKEYFLILNKPDGRSVIKWEKKVSTHIRHKVAAAVKKHFIAKAV